ncbi:MAG TPA: LPS export ABC transporter periplasmic protein LptC [Bacteroidales bacterium]|nr:LPS export ABC transporter periplasmic protein LptC [Bacteroidales bacterium]
MTIQKNIKISGLIAIWVFLIIASSCKNDIETIKALTSESNLPDVTGYDIQMSYTDSGLLKGKVLAPEVLQYNNKEEPYYEFPKGMKAVFYDSLGRQTSFIQARFAIYYSKKDLWEGRNHVYGENQVTGQKIETEQLFWNHKEERIYSDKFSKITNPDGVFTGENGFEAKENLTHFRMNGYQGEVLVNDTPAENDTGM